MLPDKNIELGNLRHNNAGGMIGESRPLDSERPKMIQDIPHNSCKHQGCSHDHQKEKGGFFKCFQKYDSSTRAFLYYHVVSGNLAFKFLLTLPFFPQLYQAYYMAKTMVIDQPLNMFLNFSVQCLAKTNLNRNIKQLLGGIFLNKNLISFNIHICN